MKILKIIGNNTGIINLLRFIFDMNIKSNDLPRFMFFRKNFKEYYSYITGSGLMMVEVFQW